MDKSIVDFHPFLEKHFITKERKELIIGNDFVEVLLGDKKIKDSNKSLLFEYRNKILFRFKNSFIVGEGFIIGTSKKDGWKKIDFSDLKDIYFTTFNFGFFKSIGGYAYSNMHFDNYIENESSGKRWFKLFREYVENEIKINEKGIKEAGIKKQKLEEEERIDKSISSLSEEVNVIKRKVDDLDKKLKQNNSFFNETKNEKKKIKKIEGELVELNSKIRSYYIISHLPQKLNGHSVFKGLFNYQSDLYSDNQLNKIVRFLNLIRDTEKKYTDLRNDLIDGLSSTDFYPVNKLNGEGGLIDIFKSINLYYNLSQGLVNCIHSNKVGFNEIIIYLEDDGVFLTRSEIEKLNYLKQIGDHLSTVGNILVQTNNNMVNGFNRLNLGLKTINNSISITNEKIDKGLSTINSTLENGNKLIGEFIGTINNKFIEFEDEISGVRNDLNYVSDQVDDVQSGLDDVQSGLWEVDSRVVDNKDKIDSLSSLTFYNTIRK